MRFGFGGFGCDGSVCTGKADLNVYCRKECEW